MIAKITDIILIDSYKLICRFWIENKGKEKTEIRVIDFADLLIKWNPKASDPIIELENPEKMASLSLDSTQYTIIWRKIMVSHFHFSKGASQSPLSFSPEMLYLESQSIENYTLMPKTQSFA